jgi:transcriptional regulator with GAF, ATPase, and Fis domain
MQPSGHVEVSSRLLSAMLRERELVPRATLLAQQAAELISGGAAIVYVLNTGKSPGSPATWTAKATAGEILLDDPTVPADSGILGTLAQEQRPLLFSGNELTREDYAHLHARRTLVSLACVPIIVNDVLVGALEAASFEGMIDSSDLQVLVDLIEHAGPGLVSGALYEEERNSLLESVSRLTQLYDLEKVFSSTLEMAELQPLITSKIREVLDVQAVNLWFVKDQDELLLMQQSGNDPTAAVGSSQRTGEGYVAEVSDSNERLLIVGDKDDVKDERLAKRNASGVDGGPFSVVVCPLVAHEK